MDRQNQTAIELFIDPINPVDSMTFVRMEETLDWIVNLKSCVFGGLFFGDVKKKGRTIDPSQCITVHKRGVLTVVF